MNAINIILDNKDPQNPIFVEIENDKGMSVRIGRSFIREDGLRNIRITGNDLLGADDERQENISNRDT